MDAPTPTTGIHWTDRHGVVHWDRPLDERERLHPAVATKLIGRRRHAVDPPEDIWQIRLLACYLAAAAIALFVSSMLTLWVAGGPDYLNDPTRMRTATR